MPRAGTPPREVGAATEGPRAAPTGDLLRLEDVSVHYPAGNRGLFRGAEIMHAVDNVTVRVGHGEILGIVGESGSGKSTLARAITRRIPLAGGHIFFDDRDISLLRGSALRRLRRDFQMVFQDPYTSLDPKMKVGAIIAEPLRVHRLLDDATAVRRRVDELLELVGLSASDASRYPHAFSGGQRQRIGIARALAPNPKLIVADEPVSALDVSIQAQILQLLHQIQRDVGMTCVFISHNLAVVRAISHRIAVMYAGKIVEIGDADLICSSPRHPYTQALLSAVPSPDPDVETQRQRIVLRGEPPNQIQPPSGCRFNTRCPIAQPTCAHDEPALLPVDGRSVACWFADRGHSR